MEDLESDPIESFLFHMWLDALVAHKPRVVKTKAIQAQDLMFDAMEAENEEEQLNQILEVLRMDPTNTDALLMVLDFIVLDTSDEIQALRKIENLAERNLGKKVFKECKGEFWGFIETRPYMRVRGRLGELFFEVDMFEEAIGEWGTMLELNKNDNQGVRYELLAACLMLGRLKEAKRLFEDYHECCDFNAVFSWCKILERLLDSDKTGALKALKAARKQNPHVEQYFKGHREGPNPDELPFSYSPGSEDEAVVYARIIVKAWVAHEDQLNWLLGQVLEPGAT